MKLPESFLQQVKELLGQEEYEKYTQAMEQPYAQALRVNTAKISPEALREKMPQAGLGENVPWCEAGIYLSEESPVLSKHPFYAAGLYYLQEPSAMAPAAFLPIEKGDKVLDVCAAPGGKSTALGAKLAGSGLLVTNDIRPSRARALLKNVELFGLGNGVVLSENPYKHAQRFAGFFDKVLVDAPCSGEGMFRKDPTIAKNWLQYGTEYYAKLQREILPHAAKMVAPGGMLLYSTCTYSSEEDEQTVQDFMDEFPEFHLVDLPKCDGIMDGQPQWAKRPDPELSKCARFWPHRLRGEGHFVALFQRDGAHEGYTESTVNTGKSNAWTKWAAENLTCRVEDVLPEGSHVEISGEKVYAMLLPSDKLNGLRVLRPGLLLGEISHDRFEPSQAFAMVLQENQVKHTAELDIASGEAVRYLKGETLNGDFADGWNLVTVSGYPLGWGKASGGVLKNKYLKGWRMMK
ncbi:MAG: RsmB/NOP family class I SAM-dependent RNA methyltransferase [Firmicutes bacterium]|nr:RsmB/NOP family class I SAM-dependent RNA methyltransferase [Bacillota bacterium]